MVRELTVLAKVDYTGAEQERGGPDAKGMNINYPLPRGCSNDMYILTLLRAINDVRHFAPELLIVSCAQAHPHILLDASSLPDPVLRMLAASASTLTAAIRSPTSVSPWTHITRLARPLRRSKSQRCLSWKVRSALQAIGGGNGKEENC